MTSIDIEVTLDDDKYIKSINALEKNTKDKSKEISDSFTEVENQVSKTGSAFKSLSETTKTFTENFKKSIDVTQVGIATALVGVSQFSKTTQTGFIGVIEATSAASLGLATLGLTLKSVDNEFAQFLGTASLVTGVLLGGLTAAVTFLIVKVGELAFNIGTNLVQKFDNASKTFIKADRNLFVFTKTIENYNKITGGVVGTTGAWTEEVNRLSSQFNVTRSELQKAATEIVAVGSRLGLTRDQLQQLLKVTTEYAKVSGKDIFDTSVRFVQALSGNAAAVTALGIKLTEASNQAFLLKKGIDENFRSLSDSEKVQVRYNNLLTQYTGIAGIAAGVAASLSDAQNALAVNVERFNTEIGKGAAIIENNNILNKAFSATLSLVSDSVLNVSGFIGALGARILQVGGIVLKFALQLAVLISGFRLLNSFLASSLAQTAFATSIPILNNSINGLISGLAGTEIRINSVKSALLAFAKVVRVQFLQLGIIFGTTTARSLTFGQAFSLALQRASSGLAIFRAGLISTLATAAPFLVTLGAIGASVFVLAEAFKFIEQRTQAFSIVFQGIKGVLAEVSPVIDTLKMAFDGLVEVISTVTSRLIGFVAFGISAVIDGLFRLVTAIPGVSKVLGEDFVNGLSQASIRLNNLRQQLVAGGFDIRSFGERALASSDDINKFKVDLEALLELRKRLENFGRSDFSVLKEQFAQEQLLLQQALQQGLLTRQQFNNAALALQQEFLEKQRQITSFTAQETKLILEETGGITNQFFEGFNARQAQLVTSSVQGFRQIGQAAFDGIGRGVGGAFAAFGKALASGENALEAFGKTLLAAIGQQAIAAGTELVLRGIAYAFDPFLAGFAPGLIAAGGALAAFGGALSAVGGGGAPSGAGNAGQIQPGPGAEFTGPQIDEIQEPGNQVTVNFNGEVFDTEGASQRVGELIRQEIERNGTSTILQVG